MACTWHPLAAVFITAPGPLPKWVWLTSGRRKQNKSSKQRLAGVCSFLYLSTTAPNFGHQQRTRSSQQMPRLPASSLWRISTARVALPTFSAIGALPKANLATSTRSVLINSTSTLTSSLLRPSITSLASRVTLSSNLLQVRHTTYGAEYQPSQRVRKRRHGFLARIKSRTGRKILARRRGKGRRFLTH